MQAITTKYLGPTNYRGSRVKATAQAKSITIEWDDALNATANHSRAAQRLANDLEWPGQWFGGGLPDGATMAWIQTDSRDSFTVIKRTLS